MSLQIIPYPTVSGIARALDAESGGFAVKAKYIQVGKGLQAIELNDAGSAVTDTLKTPVAYVEILKAKRVNGQQWQLALDLVGLLDEDWNLAEFALCDENKEVIAIYGSATQALMTVSLQLDNALLAINLVLATFPADSIVIEHHNLPSHLFFDKEFKAIHLGMTSNTKDILHLDDEISKKANTEEMKNLHQSNVQRAEELSNEMADLHRKNLGVTDKLSAEITTILADQISNMGDV